MIKEAAVIGAALLEEEQAGGPLQLVVEALAVDGQFGLPGFVIGHIVFVGVAFIGRAAADRGANTVEGAIGRHQAHIDVSEALVRGGRIGSVVPGAEVGDVLLGRPEAVGLFARHRGQHRVVGLRRRVRIGNTACCGGQIVRLDDLAAQVGEGQAGDRDIADRGAPRGRHGAHEIAKVVIGRTRVMLAGNIGTHQQAEAVVRLPFDGKNAGKLLEAHRRLGVAASRCGIEKIVGDIAFLVFRIQRHAQEQRVVQRHIEGALQTGAGIVADGGLDIAAQIGPGIPAVVENGAAGGVAAHQGALRPLEHRHSVQVEQRAGQSQGPGIIDPVLVDRRSGIERQARIAAARGRVEIALAADGDVESILAEGGGRDIDRGADIFQILDGADVQLVEVGLAQRGDGNRHRLLVFLALAGGDDHLFQPHRRGLVGGIGAAVGLSQGGAAECTPGQKGRHQSFGHRNPLPTLAIARTGTSAFGSLCSRLLRRSSKGNTGPNKARPWRVAVASKGLRNL